MPHDSAESVVFPFGKFKGYTLAHILRESPDYAYWIRDKADFSPVWREAVTLALQNQDIGHLKLPRVKTTENTYVQHKKVIEISELNKEMAKINMPYDKSLIARFKSTIDGRKWNDKEKQWEFPLVQLPKVIEIIKTYEVKVTPKIKRLYKEILEEQQVRREVREKEDTDFEIEGLKLDLFPYQKVGVEFLYHTNGRALIADQPGLGKTVQAIAYAKVMNLKTLVVAPLSVVINWRKEVKKFTGLPSTVWTSKNVDGDLENQFHIINYDAVRKVHDVLRKMDFDMLVCDEATFLKNRNTIRFKSLLGSWKERRKYPGIKTDHIVFLTGTPVMSRPIEAFTLLHILDKNRFSNFYHFTERYGGWKGVPVRNLRELHERTKDLTIRRKKTDVLKELPDKQRNDLYIEMSTTERREYLKMLDELFNQWKFSGKPTVGTMPKIQSFLIDQKMPRLHEIIDEYLDNDRPILIFCCFVEPLKRLAEHYGHDAALLHGSMKKEERQESIDKLVSEEAKVGLFSLKAAGMGIDGLQHVIDTVIFLDRDWVPANHEQAEDRVHRIGQDAKVQIYYMTVEDSIDEYMAELINDKMKIASEIVDGEVINPENSKSVFKEFVQRLTREKYLE